MESWLGLFGLGAVIIYAMATLRRLFPQFVDWMPGQKSRYEKADAKQSLSKGDPYSDITPLTDFDWQTTEPLKLRPFKPKYHLTMGLTNSTISDLIEIDKTYPSRIALRKQIIKDHHEVVVQADPSVGPAVDELYTWLVSTYLPSRFPTMFTLTAAGLLNHVTSEFIPLTSPSDPIQALEVLGGNIDDDFLLLLPSDDGDGYMLKGFITCFPSGFNTKEKFGLKLRDIHKPVPGYKDKLEKSMDRFFDRIEVGKIVLRTNWAITTHDRLFAASGNHLYEGEEVKEEEVDINNTYFRSERQMLHRLPQTKALVFSFKTYLYLLKEIKEEGLGDDLAQAIDGLEEGSVPAMYFYKRGVVWGEIVKKYLRS